MSYHFSVLRNLDILESPCPILLCPLLVCYGHSDASASVLCDASSLLRGRGQSPGSDLQPCYSGQSSGLLTSAPIFCLLYLFLPVIVHSEAAAISLPCEASMLSRGCSNSPSPVKCRLKDSHDSHHQFSLISYVLSHPLDAVCFFAVFGSQSVLCALRTAPVVVNAALVSSVISLLPSCFPHKVMGFLGTGITLTSDLT